MLLPPNPKDFLVEEVPDLHPLSASYRSFWREEKRKCIEGYWVGGYWMPPALYFYANYGTIKLNKRLRAAKVFSRPNLRDLEWDFFYHYTEARGFSGFSLDNLYSCNRILLDPNITDAELLEFYPNVMSSSGSRKTYVSARTYMRQNHSVPLGKPLFENDLSNIMMMGSRDTGKSYMVGAGLIPHTFLFDGSTEYSEESIKNPSPVEILVGAEISDKSADILKKTKECLDYLPGQKVISGRTYPAPFSKKYTGSWTVNSEIIAQYNKKVNGKWERAGSRSTIKHRSFNENPFAAQGTRPLLLVLEEVGIFSSLKDVYQHTVDTLRSGLRKTGILMMLGTGGDMDRGTVHASEMFYEPEKYDILPFEDSWEFRGKIGYFVPAYLALNEYKDYNGYSKVEEAKQALLKVREKKRGDSSSSDALNSEIQYRPLVPSEMFLSKSANIFPTAELRRRLTEIQTHKIYDQLEKKVDLYFDPTSTYNGVNYQVNFKAEAISKFPYDGDSREGTVVIYELPQLQDGKVPQGAYIIGCDPFKDDGQTGSSLAAVYVIKTTKYMSTVGHDEIVASYIGRPYLGKNHVNEILHKLSLFYGNAKIYFENAVGNVKDYFEKVHRLDLLALQPITVFNKKASYNSQQSLIYGYPMSNQKVKWEALQYLRTWLLTPRADGKRNVDLISDPGLLQELISFNMDGNFDRVMGFVGCIIGLEELYNLSRKSDIYKEAHSELDKEFDRFLVKNKRLFNENFTATNAVLPAKV
jgi:hypothetical protein